MALVNLDSLLRQVLRKLKKLQPPQGLELMSYKRNRSIGVLLRDADTILVRERGFREEERIVARAELAKHLKSLIKYEFPRSRKVRLYQIDHPSELEKKLKKL